MKKAITIFLAMAVIGTGAVLIFGQKGKSGGFGPFGGRGFDRIAEKLGLSDEQKTQAKSILEDSKSRIEPLMNSAKANRKESENLGTDGVFNEAEVTRVAVAQAETMKQLFVEKEKTKAALFAILTPEQRAEAISMRELFKDDFKDRMRNRRPFRGGPETPEGPTE